MSESRELELTCERMTYGPDAVAHDADGRTVFVSGAVAGDRVRAVVDREGHIRFPKAAPVEQWEKLQKQLEQAAQPLPVESLPFVDSPVIQPEK